MPEELETGEAIAPLGRGPVLLRAWLENVPAAWTRLDAGQGAWRVRDASNSMGDGVRSPSCSSS
jgi:hypothetical protein